MRLSRWVFAIAGTFGVILILPFAYTTVVSGELSLPDGSGAGLFLIGSFLQHIVWQIVYFIIATDPHRFRPMMVPAIFSMGISGFSSIWIYAYGIRMGVPVGVVSVLMALTFIVAYWQSGLRAQLSAA
jgi:hypothetical protein